MAATMPPATNGTDNAPPADTVSDVASPTLTSTLANDTMTTTVTAPTTTTTSHPETTLSNTELDQLTDLTTLEVQFSDILHTLTADQTLKRFKLEYEKLHNLLKKSHVNEKYLISKIRDLSSELLVNSHAIHSAVKLSTNDTHTINVLKKEISQAWQIISKNEEKEAYFKSIIEKLKGETVTLSTLVDRGTSESIGNDNLTNELLEKLKLADDREKELMYQLDTKSAKIVDLEQLVMTERELVQRCETNETTLQAQVVSLQSDLNRELKNNERYNLEILNIKTINSNIKGMLTTKNDNIESLLNKYNENDGKLKHQALLNEKQANQITTLQSQISEYEKNLLLCQTIEQNLLQERTEAIQKNMVLKRELNIEKNNYLMLNKKHEKIQKMYNAELTERDNFGLYKQYIKSQLHVILNNMKQYKSAVVNDEKLMAGLRRDNQSMSAQLVDLNDKLARQNHLIEQYQQLYGEKRLVEQSLYAVQAESHGKIVAAEKLNSKTVQKLNQSLSNEKQWHNERLTYEAKHSELQHQLAQERHKYMVQYEIYESIKADKNVMEKKYLALNDQHLDMKSKQEILEYQQQQVLNEVKSKNALLQNEYYQTKLLQDDIKLYQKKLLSHKKIIDKCDSVLLVQNTEIQHLRHILYEIECLQATQINAYTNVVKQRDTLAQQLLQRNDQLALVNEKCALLKSILSSGEKVYNERIVEIKQLKQSLQQSRQDNEVLKNERVYNNVLKNEIYSIEKKYIMEKQKNSALTTELENPLNIHRYRLLENSTPDKYNLIQKIFILQKRLIHKTEQYIEASVANKALMQTIGELKQCVKSYSNDVYDSKTVDTLNAAVKQKNKQIKVLSGELNMYTVNEAEYKFNINTLNNQINVLKKQLYERSKLPTSSHGKSQQLRSSVDISDNDGASDLSITMSQQSSAKVLGGGFQMQNTLKSPRSKKVLENNKENSASSLNALAGQ